MSLKTLAAATALAALFAAPALAQQGTPPSPEEMAARFDKADADKNGKLSMAEWKATLGDRAANATDEQLKGFFDRRDADKDGSISKAEYTAPMQRPGGGGQ
jgi:Ca2+-binding EF-hand superfamily protein